MGIGVECIFNFIVPAEIVDLRYDYVVFTDYLLIS